VSIVLQTLKDHSMLCIQSKIINKQLSVSMTIVHEQLIAFLKGVSEGTDLSLY